MAQSWKCFFGIYLLVSFESELAQIVFDPNWIQDQELSTVVQSVGPVYKVTKNERVDVFSDLKTD